MEGCLLFLCVFCLLRITCNVSTTGRNSFISELLEMAGWNNKFPYFDGGEKITTMSPIRISFCDE